MNKNFKQDDFSVKTRSAIVLIPTYNERDNVKLIIPEIFSLYPEIQILIIDDSSPDGTSEVIKNMKNQYPNLNILERKAKTGLGDAYKDAIKYVLQNASAQSIITMDADGSHQPKYIGDLLKNSKDFDLVIGSRYIKGGGIEDWEFWREKLSVFGNFYSRALTGLKINDLTAGFICIRRKILEKIDFNHVGSSGYAYQIEFKHYCVNKAGADFKEIPIFFKSRCEGESKISHQIISEGIKTPLKLFFRNIWKI